MSKTDTLLITEPDIEQALMPTPGSIVQIIGQAVAQKADIATLERLLDLQLRFEANEAKKAFVSAMNQFKANPPTIRKNKHVKFGQTEYDHATLDHVCDEVTQALSKHGISHRWDVEQKGDGPNRSIRVTCILTHELGHSESTSLEGPADTSGSKNAIQAIASTVTYLQRYALLAATGLAPSNGDNDGQGAEATGMSEESILEYCDYIQQSGNLDELQRNFAEAYKAAAQLKDKKAQQEFIRYKDARKGMLR